MSRHHVEIRSDGPFKHQVLIDGQDIARSLAGLSLNIGVDEVPRLVLDLQLVDVSGFGSTEAEVLLGGGVAKTLIKLGWTPPEEAA